MSTEIETNTCPKCGQTDTWPCGHYACPDKREQGNPPSPDTQSLPGREPDDTLPDFGV